MKKDTIEAEFVAQFLKELVGIEISNECTSVQHGLGIQSENPTPKSDTQQLNACHLANRAGSYTKTSCCLNSNESNSSSSSNNNNNKCTCVISYAALWGIKDGTSTVFNNRLIVYW